MEDRPGQKYIGFKVSEDLLNSIESALSGTKDKSQFVREAIAEKLIAMGFEINSEIISAPSRKGKGGPKKNKKLKPKALKKKSS